MAEEKFTIKRIAELAQLGLNGAEQKSISSEFDELIAYVNKLRRVATDAVPPTEHVSGLKNVSRADEVINTDPKPIVAVAPNDQYRIPSVRSLWTS